MLLPYDFGVVPIGMIEGSDTVDLILKPKKNFVVLVKRAYGYDAYWYDQANKEWRLWKKTDSQGCELAEFDLTDN